MKDWIVKVYSLSASDDYPMYSFKIKRKARIDADRIAAERVMREYPTCLDWTVTVADAA